MDSFHANYGSHHVKYFRKTSPESNIYEFEIIKPVSKFYIDAYVKSNSKNKEVYNIKNMDGCIFMSNPLVNRLFHNFYKSLLVNKTFYSCPMKIGTYFIRNEFSKNIMSPIHPRGNFTLNVQLKNNTNNGVLLDLNWSYRLVKVKN